ncbi:MAG: twin-arginine translocase subunit TatC [Bacteriovoracaceae bacterium]|nr:twin-arginine translocase subunit TatC [Bacteriovoracaceae bacterium]
MEKMSLSKHLTDLRKTLIRIAIILFISFVLCYTFGAQLSEILLAPLRVVLKDNGQIVYLGIFDKVLSYFQVALWSAVILSSPFWFFEIWGFIRPGLLPRELKVIRPFILAGFLLFCFGVCFGYFVVFPITFKMLVGFGVGDVGPMMSMKDYLGLSIKILVFLGMVFQFPNIIFILGLLKIVTPQKLSGIRTHIYVALAILSAFFTPPDILTMLGLWLPLVLLFEIGVLGVRFFIRR